MEEEKKSVSLMEHAIYQGNVSRLHMGQYPLLSVLSDRLSPLNIDHSRNLPVEICGINYTVSIQTFK